tara:strand:+ start:9887 stop:10717 length:831 start_codon:yes stop_codon:yes gene_type:complete
MIKYKDVKNKCSEGRFFSYDDWRDKLFVPPSIFLVWFFLNIGVSGNAVSILSGLLAILCGVLISYSDPLLILIGSFGYVIFYLLDYVDGGVARYNGKSGIGGQYVDWIMHVVVTVGMTTGLFIGAFQSTGLWIIPIGILCTVSSVLTYDKHSFAWYAIVMYYQQNKLKGNSNKKIILKGMDMKHNFLTKNIRRISLLFFHENYTIITYPLLAILNLYFSKYFDFRIFLILWGGLIYFTFHLWDIIRISKSNIIDKMYNKTLIEKDLPKLPEDHFFN